MGDLIYVSRTAKKNAGLVCILLILLLFSLGGLQGMQKPHQAGWDEAVYIGMGKYLFSLGGSGLWEEIRPPMVPLLLGTLWKLRIDGVDGGKVLMLLFALGVIVLTYLLGKEIGNWGVGLAAAALVALTPLFVEQSARIMTETPSTFFALLAWYLYLQKKGLLWPGITIGLATLTRFPQGLLILVLGATVLQMPGQERVRQAVLAGAGMMVVMVPFMLFNAAFYSSEGENPVAASLLPFTEGSRHQASPFHPGSVLFYGKLLVQQNVLFIAALLGIVAAWNRNRKWLMLAPFLLGLYFSLIPNKQERFILVIVPYVALLAAVGLFRAVRMVQRTRWRWPLTIVVIMALGAAMLTPISRIYHQSQEAPDAPDPRVPFFIKLGQGEGSILTTTPLPAAYTDRRFIPMYDNPARALETYRRFGRQAAEVLYHRGFYPCQDAACERAKQALDQEIRRDRLIEQQEFGGEQYGWYRITSPDSS